MIVWVAETRPAILERYVRDNAKRIALAMAMRVLDNEGIAHCAFCVSRSQLRRYKEGWVCHQHIQPADEETKIKR